MGEKSPSLVKMTFIIINDLLYYPTHAIPHINQAKHSHEQNKRTLQRYFNFLTSARAFKC